MKINDNPQYKLWENLRLLNSLFSPSFVAASNSISISMVNYSPLRPKRARRFWIPSIQATVWSISTNSICRVSWRRRNLRQLKTLRPLLTLCWMVTSSSMCFRTRREALFPLSFKWARAIRIAWSRNTGMPTLPWKRALSTMIISYRLSKS